MAIAAGDFQGAVSVEHKLDSPSKMEAELPQDPAIPLSGLYPRFLTARTRAGGIIHNSQRGTGWPSTDERIM